MTDKSLRLAVVQADPVLGDIDGNLSRALSFVDAHSDADLVVFPECFLTGYPIEDLALRPGFITRAEDALSDLHKAVIEREGPGALIGAPVSGADLPYNAAVLLSPDGARRVTRKVELPSHDVFDERRVFASEGGAPSPVSFRGVRLGVLICEDVWHGRVSRALADEGAEALIALNGSPYERGKREVRHDLVRARTRETGLPVVYANLVGGQDELVFDGASFVHDPDGGLWEVDAFTEKVMDLVLKGDASGLRVVPRGAKAPVSAQTPATGLDYAACVTGLRGYVTKIGAPHVVVGVSGGIDSALVLTMAVDALGADKVIGVMMPSRHTGEESLDLANDLMTRLGVRQVTAPVEPGYKVMTAGVEAAVAATVPDTLPDFGVTRENLQSRLRAVTLMGMTNAIGGIVLSTGNKSEMSAGYATLYGDMCGGFNPLKSVYKSDAFRMARWRNAATGVLGAGAVTADPIPDRIITRPPSAELAPDQNDEDALGDYEVLDMTLRGLIEDRLDARSVARRLAARMGEDHVVEKTGETPAVYAARVSRLTRIAQYKRDQSPPGVKLNPTDFGPGWRYPVAGRYEL